MATGARRTNLMSLHRGAIEGRDAVPAFSPTADSYVAVGAGWGIPLGITDAGQPLKLAWRVQSLGVSTSLDHQHGLLSAWAGLTAGTCGFIGVLEPGYAAAVPSSSRVIDVLAARHSPTLPLDGLSGAQQTLLAQHYGFPSGVWSASDGWEQLRSAGHVLAHQLGLRFLCPFVSAHQALSFDEILKHGLVLLGSPYDVCTRFMLDVLWLYLQAALERLPTPPLVVTSGAFGLPRDVAQEVCQVCFNPPYPTTSTLEWRNGQQFLMTPSKMYQWPLQVDAASSTPGLSSAADDGSTPDWASVRYMLEQLWYGK